MDKFDRLVNEMTPNWTGLKRAGKTALSHGADILTGGISSAVTDTVDAYRGKDAGSEVEKLQGQVDQQAQQAASQADQEAQVDQQHQAEIQQAQAAADSLDQTQEQEIDINQQKIAQVDQRLGKLEQIVQQVSSQLNQPSASQPI